MSTSLSGSVPLYLLIHFGQHITPLPVKMSVNENACRAFACAATYPTYTVTSPHYKKKKRRETHTCTQARLIPPLLSEHVRRSAIPWAQCFLILSARHSSLGRVTRWELWVWLLRGEETSTSKRGQKEKLKSWVLWGEETDCLSEAYQSMEGYMHSQASEDWY